ncbi:hypothetical protein LTR16_010158, partial [Cryomyces antarcticus]
SSPLLPCRWLWLSPSPDSPAGPTGAHQKRCPPHASFWQLLLQYLVRRHRLHLANSRGYDSHRLQRQCAHCLTPWILPLLALLAPKVVEELLAEGVSP